MSTPCASIEFYREEQEEEPEEPKLVQIEGAARKEPVAYKQVRPVKQCINCREVKQMHAHNLCFDCYQKNYRARQLAADTQGASKEIRQERKKMIGLYASTLKNHVDDGDTEAFKVAAGKMIAYLLKVADIQVDDADDNNLVLDDAYRADRPPEDDEEDAPFPGFES